MINWNARYDEVIIGDVEEEEKEKRSLTLIGDGVLFPISSIAFAS